MGRFKKFGTALIGALLVTGLVTVSDVGSAPVPFSPTPMIGWSTNGIVRAVVIVGNTAYVGGDFTQVRGPGGTPTMARARLAAFDITTGAIRTGFSADANSRVYALASDGTRLFVGGDFTTIKGQSRARLASVDLTTGNVNTGFSANASSRVLNMKASGSRLYVAGQFTTLGNQTRSRLAAVSTTTGAVDLSFDPNADAHVKAVTVSPDGNTVYAGGDFTAIGGGTRSYIASLSAATGALLPLAFQYPLVNLSVPTVIDLDISPSGDRLFGALGGYENQALSWSTVTGRRQWGRQVQGDAQAVKYFNGNIYFGFHEGDLGGDLTVRLLAADASTGITEPTLRPTINSFFGVWDIDAAPSALVIVGEFTNVNGVATTGFAILPRTSTDPVAPTPPSNLRVTASTSTSITLAWDPGTDNVGVAGYRVLRNGVEIGFPTATTFTDTDLPGSTDFTYSVQTVDAPGNFSSPAGPIPAGTDTTLIPAGASWRYLDNGSNQGTAWRATAFNDTTWASGPAQLGYGDGDEATVVSFGPDPNNRYRTTYFRHQIPIANAATLTNVNLTLLRDDGAVIYVNGVEVARSNMPTGTITSTTYASTNAEGAAETQLFTFPVPAARFVTGTNTIAVEIHQQYRSSSDLSFDLILSTGRTVGPLAPTNLRTTAVTGTTADLAWDAPGGSTITGYKVFRDGVLVGTPTGTTFPDTGLNSVQNYSYTVTAVDAASLESPPSAALSVTTPDVIAPAAPTGLAASGVTAIRAVLDWAPATDNVGVTGYEVLRDGVPVGTPSGTTFTDNGVVVNTSYSYTVRARDAAGNWSPESDPLIVTTPELAGDITAPSVPLNLRTVSRGSTSLNLAWDASTDDTEVTGYIVTRNGTDLPLTTGTTLNDVLLAPGLTYTYTVRAIDGALNTSAASAPLVVATHLAAETTFPANSVWRYTDDGINLGTAWRTVAYNDSAWKTGAGQLGYGDGDETTVMWNGGTVSANRWISHYMRRSFTISDAAQVSGVTLSVLRDDGVVVYVNGVEAFRNNMPTGTINFNTFANVFVDGAAEAVYNDFAIPPSMLVEGNNVIAISVHQNSRSGSGDLSFDARLTTRY